MVGLTLTVRGNGLRRFAEAVETLGEGKARKVYRMAVNDAGGKTKTKTGQALAKQTGLKPSVTRKALSVSKASDADLTYSLRGQGGDISLKYFGAREIRKGVSAAPFGQREVFAHHFIKGGRFPNRKEIGRGGHVFEPDTRTGDWGRSFTKAKSGVVIPNEMVKGVTAQTFDSIGLKELSVQIEKQIKRATKGVVS
jgi:hypothetical protein